MVDWRLNGPGKPSDSKDKRHSGYQWSAWWRKPAETMHSDVIAASRSARHLLRTKRTIDQNHLRIYANYDVAATGETGRDAASILMGADGRMRYQLCTAVVDTAQSIICSNKPVPYYLTEGEDFSTQRKARNRSKIIQGQMYDIGLYDIAPRVARDGMILGSGWIYGYLDVDGKPCIEPVLPGEIHYDPSEAISGNPRSIYRTQLIARDTLLGLFPDHEDIIERSGGPSADDWRDFYVRRDSTADLVSVTSAWHLGRGKDRTDGKCVIVTDAGVLHSADYTHDEFPFVQYRWKERVLGYTGCGLVEETKLAQLRINRLIRVVERQQDLGSNSWVYVENSSEVKVDTLTNLPMSIVRYTGMQPPTIAKHEGTPYDLRSEIAAIKAEVLEQVGLNSAQTQGQVPQNVTSARGQKFMEQIASRRHVINQQQYERFFVDCARLLERLNDDAAALAKKEGRKYYVTTSEMRGRTEVLTQKEWSKSNVAAKTQLRCWPISALPSTPAGKMDTVTEFLKNGFISPMWALKLLDFPDLDQAMALELADLNLILWHMESIVHDEAENILPTPMLGLPGLAQAVEISRKTYNHAELLGVDEETRELIRQYHEHAKSLLKTLQAEEAPPAPPMSMGAAMPPQGGPQPGPDQGLNNLSLPAM
jgi:hypothetical protein